ncbi:MAG: HAD family hydrolase [bacterium]|nr:HAD family hydrolase [bacterium]
MKYKAIIFDLHGPLSDSAYLDKFWLEVLPRLYAKRNNLTVRGSKKILKKRFKEYGENDYRYYSATYWLGLLNLKSKLRKIIKETKGGPFLFSDMLEIVKSVHRKAKTAIISSTIKEIIHIELGRNKRYFDHIYASIDDFGIVGKPRGFYTRISKSMGIKPNDILHIGNNIKTDVKNAKAAGFNVFFFDKKRPRREVVEELKALLKSNEI